jgi:hypothetical protein
MCKPNIKKMNWLVKFITGGWALAITLAPFGIYVRKEYWYWQDHNVIKWNELINHESIHWKQQMEMLIIFFYLWYLIEWIIRIFVNWGHSYYAISFEHEAHEHEKDLKYLETRKHYAWLKHMKYRE